MVIIILLPPFICVPHIFCLNLFSRKNGTEIDIECFVVLAKGDSGFLDARFINLIVNCMTQIVHIFNCMGNIMFLPSFSMLYGFLILTYCLHSIE